MGRIDASMNADTAQSDGLTAQPLCVAIWIDEQNLLNEFTLLRQMSVALSAGGVRVYIISEHDNADSLRAYTAGHWHVQSCTWINWVRTGRTGNEYHVAAELHRHQISFILLMGWSPAQAAVLSRCRDISVVRWHFDLIIRDDAKSEMVNVYASSAIRAAFKAPERAMVISPGIYIGQDSESQRSHSTGGDFILACLDVIHKPDEYAEFLRALAGDGRLKSVLLLLLDAGDAKDEVWRIVRDMKLSDRVSFIPAVGAATAAIRNSDAVINISSQTRWWHVGIEAAAARRAVVCRGAALMDDFDGDTCRLVRQSDDWADCLEELRSDAIKTRTLCEHAYLRVKRRHAMSDFYDRLMQVTADLRRDAIPLR